MAFLIDTQAEIKRQNSAVAVELVPESIRSFLDDADITHIIPAIGRETFTAIIEGKSSLEAGSPQQTLLLLLQKSAVNFALAGYANSGALSISNAGISVIKNANRLPASDAKLKALRSDCLEAGYNALEKAVDFLEENTATFTDYAQSQEHSNNRALFINSATEFQSAGVNINNSAQLYQILRIYQTQAELDKIEPLLGTTITASLRTGILNNNLTQPYTLLLKKVQKPLAFFSMAEALSFLSVTINPLGVFERSSLDTSAPASETLIGLVKARMQSNAEKELLSLQNFLTENASDYAYTPATPVILNDDPLNNIYVA